MIEGSCGNISAELEVSSSQFHQVCGIIHVGNSRASANRHRLVACLHVNEPMPVRRHRAKHVSETKRSGIELHGGKGSAKREVRDETAAGQFF